MERWKVKIIIINKGECFSAKRRDWEEGYFLREVSFYGCLWNWCGNNEVGTNTHIIPFPQ